MRELGPDEGMNRLRHPDCRACAEEERLNAGIMAENRALKERVECLEHGDPDAPQRRKEGVEVAVARELRGMLKDLAVEASEGGDDLQGRIYIDRSAIGDDVDLPEALKGLAERTR